MIENIRTGVIGVGSMGKNHARIYNEISDFEEAFNIHPATHGSWNMCSSCVSDPNSSSKKLITEYRNLLESL